MAKVGKCISRTIQFLSMKMKTQESPLRRNTKITSMNVIIKMLTASDE